MRLDDPERLAGFSDAHVMILPQGRRRVLITDTNQHLASARGFYMDVGRLMFSRRRVDVDAERAFLVYLDHVER